MVKYLLLLIMIIPSAISASIVRPWVVVWDLDVGWTVNYHISVQCNDRPETIYTVGPYTGLFNVPHHEIGDCVAKVASAGSTTRSEWSNEVKELIVLEAPTATIE